MILNFHNVIAPLVTLNITFLRSFYSEFKLNTTFTQQRAGAPLVVTIRMILTVIFLILQNSDLILNFIMLQ